MTTPTLTTATAASSKLIEAVAATWRSITKRNPDTPDVMITIGSGTQKAGLKLGHFAASAWQRGDDQVPELFIGGEGLSRGAEGVLTTLLHEAAHGVAHTRKIEDTSRNGRYHNERFKAVAEEVGITVTKSRQGWSDSELPADTAKLYRRELDRLTAALVAYRRTFGAEAGGRKSNNNGVSAVCGCERKIRVSRTVYELGPILCGLCAEPFIDPEAGADDEDEDHPDED